MGTSATSAIGAGKYTFEESQLRSAAIGSRLRRLPLIRSLAGCDVSLTRLLDPDWTVLDVGCGNGSRSAPHALARAIGVDVHFASLVKVQNEKSRLATACGALEVLPFADCAVDAVVALDVIEHFTKERAEGLLDEFERVARRAILLLTPNGYVPQAGTPGNPFMEHLSGWSTADLKALGYSVSGVNGWRPLRGSFAAPRFGPVGRALSMASQPIVRRFPEQAFHLLAVKNIR